MKVFIQLFIVVTVPALQVAIAGDGNGQNGADQPGARSTASTTTSQSNLGQLRNALRSNTTAPRVAAVLPQQAIRRSQTANIAPNALRAHVPRQTLAFSQRRQAASTPDVKSRAPVNNRLSYFNALRRRIHERHDCNWWKKHFPVIVFVSTGYYYLDAGYWYPAWGYDPRYDYYDYDGPIYTYGDLLPDQVVVNVQSALQEEGYYSGTITGSLGPSTRAALAAYQRDHGLVVTGAIDEPTIESLGLD